ncbi:hypothetical protein Tco_0089651 [Tanacetum coccineum]
MLSFHVSSLLVLKCGALQDAVGGWEWVDMMVFFLQKELEVVPNIDAVVKTARFLKENLSNDDKRVRKLLNMEIEAGISSDQNGCFFQTL